MNPNFVSLAPIPATPPFRFVSQNLPGAIMNRFGVVYFKGQQASPAVRGMIQREALAAGCRQVPDPNPDIGLIWIAPE